MSELAIDCVLVVLRCISVFYIARFLLRQIRTLFTNISIFKILPFYRTGVWGYILLLATVAYAAPLIGEDYSDVTFDQQATSLLSIFNPTRWPMIPSMRRSSHSPTLNLDTIELARYYGYDAERHWVQTEDGYILGVHRIFNSSVGQERQTPKPVVLIHHAFVLSSREFLLLGPQKALGFVLADNGYDVWLCNARGNTFSRNHTTLSPEKKEFWDWSFTEHGTKDIPAVVDYALKTTGRSKVHYIGHSIGTKGFEQVGAYEFLPHKPWLTTAGNTVCNEGWFTQRMCTAFLFAICGDNPKFNRSNFREILNHGPAGSSLKTFRHFGQNFHYGFRDYDYGEEQNLIKYNSKEPPMFDITKVNVPSQLFYGVNDLLAEYKDSIKICQTLPNVFRCEEVADKNFGHIDFIWTPEAADLVYPKVLEGLRRFDDDSVSNAIIKK